MVFKMNLLVFGLGYTARRFVDLCGHKFARVSGTVRNPGKREWLKRLGVYRFDGAAYDPEIVTRINEADVILVSVPPDGGRDPVLSAFAEVIAASPARVVYLSTVGVYADHGGEWIDEDAAARDAERATTRLAVEAQWKAIAGERLAVLRLAGIYGPGRNAFVRLREGTARRIVKPGQIFNRIHADDIAGAIMAAIDREASGVWNIGDDEPAPPQDVIAYAATMMGIAPPPEQDFATAEMTPMARSFYATSNRVSNARAKRDLGFKLAYPTYREGLAQLWNSEAQSGS